MENLEAELKELIISTLNLEDIRVDEIADEEPLFVNGLGLDSIDALELGVAIKKKYNVVLQADDSETKNILLLLDLLPVLYEQVQSLWRASECTRVSKF